MSYKLSAKFNRLKPMLREKAIEIKVNAEF